MNSLEIYRSFADDYVTADKLAEDLGITRDEVLKHITLGCATKLLGMADGAYDRMSVALAERAQSRLARLAR